MTDPTLYDEDILLWSEQQAAAIRKLARARGVSNELDIENVAQEIESVGRSELAAVKSYLRLLFVHVIKLAIETGSEARSHWRGEIVAFHSEVIERYTPSMRQRINLDQLWDSARDQSLAAYDGLQHQLVRNLGPRSPFVLDELLAERIDVAALVERLRSTPAGAE